MHGTIRASPAFLALAGLISGALTILVSSIPSVEFVGVGFTFGLVLLGYFKGFEKQRSSLKLALILCICTVAWPVSNLCAFGAMVLGQAFSSVNPPALSIPLPAFFVGGFAGALMVLGAGTILFGHRRVNRRVVAMVLLYSVGCGVLGVIGAAADGMSTHWIYHKMRFIPLVWEPGTALMLGLLIRNHGESKAAERIVMPVADENASEAVENPRLVGGVFLTLLAGLIGLWVFHIVQVEREGIRLQIAQRRYDAEAPSHTDLAPVEALPLEQVLILDKIDGLYPFHPLAWPPGRLERKYSVAYTATEDPPPTSFVQQIVVVDVVQMPNEVWAQYRGANPRLNALVVSPDSLSKVRRFGQRLFKITTRDRVFTGQVTPLLSRSASKQSK